MTEPEHTTTDDHATGIVLQPQIVAMTPGDQLRLAARLVDAGDDQIAETLASHVIDLLRLRRLLGKGSHART